MTDLAKIAEEIRSSKNIAVVLHRAPDGDAVGSALALKEGLRNLATVQIISSEPIAQIFEKICGKVDYETSLPNGADLIILPDTSELHRTGFQAVLSKKVRSRRVLVIDHHATGDLNKIATHSLHSDEAASTTEIIYDLMCEMRLEMSPRIATLLLLGLYTDTGGFQHRNTSSNALKLAGRLVNSGGNLHLISQTLSSHLSLEQKRLWGHLLEKVTINKLGLATAKIHENDLTNLGASRESLTGLANKLALIKEARAVCMMVEEGNSWRCVLRTRFDSINLQRLAKMFGGTGTKKAAGFTVTKETISSKIHR